MDDDSRKSDKPKGPRGPRPDGGRGGRPAGKGFGGGKPGGRSFGGKPGGKSFGAKPGGKSSGGARFAKDGAAPRSRDFARGDRPEGERAGGERAERPFRKGPRPERGDGDRPRFEGKPRFEGGKRPFAKDRAGDGEKRSFRPRREESSGDAPRRREFSPRREGEESPQQDRPFRKPREFSARNAPSEGFRERPPRRESGEGGESRSFDKPRNQRPGRFEREQTRGEDGDRPRSFGMKRHAGPREEGAERPRSYGQKSHGDKSFGDRPRGDRPHGDRSVSRRAEAVEESGERIAKRLARAGIASRREAEDLVAAGRVRVNGQVLTSPAFNVEAGDRIELDGNEIPAIERTRLFLFHKPTGVVTTNRDPEGRKTVFDVLPQNLPRLMTVGRLDINTEGLLLLTNDGGLARVLELPATGWLRRYRVRVHGEVDESALAGLRDGIAVDGVFYGAIEASLERIQGTNAWLTIGLREGKNREVKNILGALGLEVTRLIRVSFGPFQLGELPEGEVQELKGRTLRDQLGERLIAEAGANFEAPVTKPFSNRAEQVRAPEERTVRGPARVAIEPGEGGLIKSRKRRREEARDDALGRLSTRPERGSFGDRGDRPAFRDKPFGKPGFGKGGERGEGREKRAPEPPKSRKSNVWMAPGARPQGKSETKRTPSKGGKGSGPRSSSPRRPRKD